MGVYPCPGCGALFVSVNMTQAPHAPDCAFLATSENSVEDVPVERPSPERAAWLLSLVSSIGRLKIDAFQYEELRAEAVALRAELAACAALRDEALPVERDLLYELHGELVMKMFGAGMTVAENVKLVLVRAALDWTELMHRFDVLAKQTSAAVARANAKVAALQTELARERAILAALMDSLPRCDEHRDRPATRARGRGGHRFCDECGTRDDGRGPVPEYPRAAPLRAFFGAASNRGGDPT